MVKKNQPINLVKYDKQKFTWPSPCPYILVPICNGFEWYWDAYFELNHKWETLKFRIPTKYHLFYWYDAQVFKYSVSDDIVYIKVSQSDNSIKRGLGFYKIVKK